jgi:GNAT superfamily N-acetyltransferase
MTDVFIRFIGIEQARPLRRAILRPDPAHTVDFPKDDDPETRHLGAYLDDELVGIATVSHQIPPGEDRTDAWQLQAIGVSEKARGRGVGKTLVDHCLRYVRNQGGAVLWASGRTVVLPFYHSLGFQTRDEEYVTETGPHYLIWRDVESGV